MRTLLLLTCLAIGFAAAGCSGGSDAPTSQATVEQSNRLADIEQKTGGDWSKLTASDKDYLINTICKGSESTAKIVLAGAPTVGPPKPK